MDPLVETDGYMSFTTFYLRLRSAVQDMRGFLDWSLALLVVGVFSGLAVLVIDPPVAQAVMQDLMALVGDIADYSVWQILLFILLNNIGKVLVMIVLGVLLGIVPLIFLLVNGFVLGVVLGSVLQTGGPALAAAGLLPHGIIELPVMVLAGAVGLKLGWHLWERIRRRSSVPITVHLRSALILFFTVLTPLLLLAAAVEAFITPLAIGLVGQF